MFGLTHIVDCLKYIARGLFPDICVLCKKSDTGRLCSKCWVKCEMISPPICDRCGSMTIKSCCTGIDFFDKTRSFVIYKEPAKKLLISQKNNLTPAKIEVLANWAYQAGKDLWPVTDYIVPVPSHWLRVLWRGHNLARSIAQRVSDKTGIPLVEALGAKFTPKQEGKNAKERAENVEQKFFSKHIDISGARIALIDDLITSGATMNACATILKTQGASAVYAISVMTTEQIEDKSL